MDQNSQIFNEKATVAAAQHSLEILGTSEAHQLSSSVTDHTGNQASKAMDGSTGTLKTKPANEEDNESEHSEGADTTEDRKEDDDEEEEEEEEEDKIVEKSPNNRFHKRNKRFPRQVPGIDNAFIAIEPKSGKEVIWNEMNLLEKRTEFENRFLAVVKKLKKNYHPFFVRFLDAWVSKSGPRKMVFVTERLDEGTLKQFMCNTQRSMRLWKRHIGQLLSVLRFLAQVGVNHGNLTNETIYYQSSGSIKIGTFALDGFLNPQVVRDEAQFRSRGRYLAPEYNDPNAKITSAVDIYAMGVLALEIAVWDPSDDQTQTPQDRLQRMLSRVENTNQLAFIHACLEKTPQNRPSLKNLINHPAMIEVPTLKLLSAKVIVGTVRSGADETGESHQIALSVLLKDYSSQMEDETVIMEVVSKHDATIRSRSWKDFRSNFTITSKYLEDVKNGFYPLFGCRAPSATDEDEDEDLPDTSGLTSTSRDRKESNMVRPSDPVTNRKVSAAVGGSSIAGGTNSISSTPVGMSASSSFATLHHHHHHRAPSLQADDPPQGEPLPPPQTLRSGSSSRQSSMAPGGGSATSPEGTGEHGRAPAVEQRVSLSPEGSGEMAGEATETRSPDTQALNRDENGNPELECEVCNNEVVEGTERSPISSLSRAERSRIESQCSLLELDEDEGEEEDPEDEEEPERLEPQLVQVAPPGKAPSYPALFTHCEYTYLGCGRWQVYIQMWFVEERLKREGFLQVLDHEWHNIDDVADLFEGSRALSTEDRQRLVRYLDYARHNWPLIDGELKAPNTQMANFDAHELSKKLTALQFHQQASEQGVHSGVSAGITTSKVNSKTSSTGTSMVQGPREDVTAAPAHTCIPEEGTSGSTKRPINLPVDSTEKAPPPIGVTPTAHYQTAPTSAQGSHTSSTGVVSEDTSAPRPPLIPVSEGPPSAPALNDPEPPVDSLTSVHQKALSGRKEACPVCDRHDYLHQLDLPPYLTSPCYHCREALMKEAKMDPETLLDLHLQHNIPWPAYLQARFSIPPDDRTLAESIAYDCRWRGRKPCRCLPGHPLMPPCVEFPWLYQDTDQDLPPLERGSSPRVMSPEHGGQRTRKISTTVAPPSGFYSRVEDKETGERMRVCSHCESVEEGAEEMPTPSPDQPQPSANEEAPGSSFLVEASPPPADVDGRPPCHDRHERGAPMVCCHGVQFPRLPSSSSQHHRRVTRA